MGSNLSCVKKKPGQAVPADDGCDVDGHAYSTTTDYHGPPNSVVSLTPPPSTASKHHQPVENQYSNCSSGNDDANHHNNNTDKPKHPTRSVPVLPPLAADSKLAKTDDSKPGLNKPNMAIVHDQNGYALVIPKSDSNFDAAAAAAATTNGNTRTSSSSAGQNDSPVACNVGNNKNGKNATAGVKTVKADDKIKPSQTDTGAYCNVVLAGDLGTRSFSNDLYDDTDMQVPAPKLPESTRNVVKIADSKENSQNSQLNYIQVEFVNPSDETSKAHLKPDRSNTPTQYSDVINDNGVVRVMT